MTDSSFGLGTIGQIAMTVHDLDTAVAFYRDKLGIKHLFSVPKLAFFDCDGVRLMLSLPERAEFDRGNSVLYFKVADLQAAYETLRARGIAFEDTPHLIAKMPGHDLWMAFLRDPDNNLIGLMSEVRA